MRTLNRNKRRFFYALYLDKVPIQDEWGNNTGEYKLLFSKPIESFGNISAARGETSTQAFGENEIYDKVLVMDSEAPPIDEYSILWIDSLPRLNRSGELLLDENQKVLTPHDFIVKRVAKSINSVSFAISKVEVSS